jgi:hypothetical protein
MYDVQANKRETGVASSPTLLVTENRFEAVRYLNSFFKEDTWIGIRNFIDTGNGAGKLKNMVPFEGKALIDDKNSSRYRHMDSKTIPSKKDSDILFYIEDKAEFARYGIWAPFQIQYDEKRDAMYVLTKLQDFATIYVFAHRPISAIDRKHHKK